MQPSGSADVVVIGAGAAGIAAARTALSLGLTVTILEAKDRVGGRAYTSTAEFDFPFDHGAHWMHSASLNPMVGFANSLGFDYLRLPARRHLHFGDRWGTSDEVADWLAYTERQWQAIAAAAEGPDDVAALSAIEPHDVWRQPFLAWFAMLSSVDAAHVSVRDHVAYRDTMENWPLPQGFGTLVARLGDGLPLRLGCPAETVRWGGPGVSIDTPHGRLQTRAAIMTVSTGVLAHGAIAFDPPLPAGKQSAAAGLQTGKADKIAIAFDRDVFGVEIPYAALSMVRGRDILGFQIRPFGHDVAIGFAGGDYAGTIEALDDADAVALATDQLAGMFGTTLRRHVSGAIRTRWGTDPFIRGGYSAAAVGHAGDRAVLSAPLAGRLFFAGEATSAEFFSTVHGAWLSGIAAAAAVGAELSRAGHPTVNVR